MGTNIGNYTNNNSNIKFDYGNKDNMFLLQTVFNGANQNVRGANLSLRQNTKNIDKFLISLSNTPEDINKIADTNGKGYGNLIMSYDKTTDNVELKLSLNMQSNLLLISSDPNIVASEIILLQKTMVNNWGSLFSRTKWWNKQVNNTTKLSPTAVNANTSDSITHLKLSSIKNKNSTDATSLVSNYISLSQMDISVGFSISTSGSSNGMFVRNSNANAIYIGQNDSIITGNAKTNYKYYIINSTYKYGASKLIPMDNSTVSLKEQEFCYYGVSSNSTPTDRRASLEYFKTFWNKLTDEVNGKISNGVQYNPTKFIYNIATITPEIIIKIKKDQCSAVVSDAFDELFSKDKTLESISTSSILFNKNRTIELSLNTSSNHAGYPLFIGTILDNVVFNVVNHTSIDKKSGSGTVVTNVAYDITSYLYSDSGEKTNSYRDIQLNASNTDTTRIYRNVFNIGTENDSANMYNSFLEFKLFNKYCDLWYYSDSSMTRFYYPRNMITLPVGYRYTEADSESLLCELDLETCRYPINCIAETDLNFEYTTTNNTAKMTTNMTPDEITILPGGLWY